MKKSWARLFLLALLGLVATSVAHAVALPTPALDHSQPTGALISLGMPSPDRSWSSTDYERAADVVERIANENPLALPRHGSVSSGVVFARIVAQANIEPGSTIRGNTGQEIQFALGILPPLNRIMLAYVSVSKPDSSFDKELVELIGLMLRLSVRILDVADRFLRALPKDDPTFSTRLEGLDRMKGGISEMFSGALDTLSEREMYRKPVLLSLSGVIEETLPAAISSFTPATQQEFRLRVSKLAGEEADPSLRAAMKQISSKLEVTDVRQVP